MEKSNHEAELEKLGQKIEMYRVGLAALKAERSVADIHTKKRLTLLEKNVDQLKEKIQLLEMLFEEVLTKPSSKKTEGARHVENVKADVKPNNIAQHESTHPQPTPAKRTLGHSPSTVPSFKQLQQIAQQQGVIQSNESPTRPVPRHDARPPHANPERRDSNVYKEMDSTSEKPQALSEIASKRQEEPQYTRKELENAFPLEMGNYEQSNEELENAVSSLWKKFKKK